MSGTIRLTRVYDAPIEVVWDLVATSEGLDSWLMPNDFRPEVGHRFTFTDKPRRPFYDGIVGCEVLTVDPPTTLSFTWTGGPVDTVVTFGLQAVGAQTRLTLTHAGFAGLRSQAVRAILDLGWRDLLRRQLPAAMSASHPTR